MTKFKLLIGATALAVGGMSGFAFAKGHDGERSKLKDSFAQRKAEKLAKFDSNKDGRLDDAERTAMHDERVTARFAKLDLNKDGSITLAEMKAAKPQGRRGHGRHRGHRMSK
ncbi:MAG: EF-hand domain-containing protein [Myxococcota bacterium]|nr:EF-hand domain-containing protein [Deltaproteobacteria bacterium]MDQ3337274.1 EF-hand domain-containing protein [Myxococcota bacterium]